MRFRCQPAGWGAAISTGAVLLCLVAGSACSLKKLALGQVAGMLSAPSGGTVFTGDDDPELVGDALPFAIKFYESLLNSLPGHEGLRLRTASLYVMYANAFVQTPADMIPRNEIEQKEFLLGRAKNLYLRGRDMLLLGLERKNPQLRRQLQQREYRQATARFSRSDAAALYWASAGWVAAFAIDPFDMKLGMSLPQAAALMERVLELDPGFSRGAVHNFYILYYGALPEYMGGSSQRAREHFAKALAAGGSDTSPYISLASTVSVKEQDGAEYRSLLQKVLAADVNADPDNRLVNILNQRKAKWMLAHIDDYFLTEEGGQEAEKEKTEDRR